MNKHKEKIFLTIAFIFGLLLSFFAVSFLSSNNKLTKTNSPSSSRVSISLSSEAPYGLTLSSLDNEVISGVSVRLIYDYKGKARPSIQKTKTNNDLTTLGWVYPVNQVNYDDVNGIATVDISAINTLPGGYQLTGQTLIANLNSSLPFTFDKGVTKLVGQDGHEISLDYLVK